MPNTATIIGVHEIEADEPVYLIEIEVTSDVDQFAFGDLTQADANAPATIGSAPMTNAKLILRKTLVDLRSSFTIWISTRR